ncbi:MAG: bifunctional DedA family/phosphatase PAP2 family protein [Streptosporangiales bacterium]
MDSVIGTIARHILGLNGWPALAVVFALPMLESAAFIGFVFPGEIAVILGGVLAYEGRISLSAALAAAIAGAILGDTIGYAAGRRFGRRLIYGSVGRLVNRRHIERGERYLALRGGKAVFLGRFTAALRVMVPGLAGMARMRYRTFVTYNVAGGAAWAVVYVLVGYLAGASWRRVEHVASRAGLAAVLVVVLAIAVVWLVRKARRDRLRVFANRLGRTRPVLWAYGRFPRQVRWVVRRLDPTVANGLALTLALAVACAGTLAFAGLTQDVLAHEEIVEVDPQVLAFTLAHRTGWLTAVMQAVTWFGSSAVLVPVLVAASLILVWWRRDLRVPVELWVTYGGAVVLYTAGKSLVDRARPPASDALVHASNAAFPSGHATQAIAAWGILALVLIAGHARVWRVVVPVCALCIVVLVGVSRIYLGVHWLTDVLGGYTLGGAWLALVLAYHLHSAARSPGSAEPPATLPATPSGPGRSRRASPGQPRR